ncbi:PQQ-binding-like beta-propeller repeat protein [uncultured Rubinisphaera sp.]|uniref:outer membrane protein assembly factor BamB family protein n=1 Tax=uncultured Rubinisphaera sp. TaxID=1678686 RepID=UPI0030D7B4B8
MMNRLFYCFAMFGILTFSCSANAGENWTEFQDHQQVELDQSWNWSQPPKTTWKIQLDGYGQSSPVTWDDQVFITSVEGDNKENCLITAYALKDGKKLWQQSLVNPSPVEATSYVSKAAPTPVIDRNQIVTFFEGGLLASYSLDGKLQWQKNLVEENGPIDARHGLSSSLEQNAANVFAWVERQTDPYVLCLNKQSGEVVWKVAGLGVTSWASPRILTTEGGDQLLLSGIGKIVALDPETGSQFWEFTEISGNSTPTPFPLADGRFLMGATTGQGDGNEGRAAESNGVIAISKSTDGTWSANYVWKAKKATSSFGTPVANQEMTFFVNKTGIVFGLDLNSGEERLAERTSGSVWATPLLTENHLLLFGKSGTLDVFRLGEKPELVQTVELFTKEADATNPFAGPTLYAAIVVQDKILIRTGTELICLESAKE